MAEQHSSRRIRLKGPERRHEHDRSAVMGRDDTVPAPTHGADTDFWTYVYRGHPIAILSRYGRLYVYLDHVLQHNVVFENGEDALAWLLQRVDRGKSARAH
jgi:hypothetical protein